MTEDLRDHDQSMDDADSFVDALNAALDGDPAVDLPDSDALPSLLATLRAVQATPLDAGETLSVRQRDDLWTAIVREATPRAVPVSAHAAGFHATYPSRSRLGTGRIPTGQGAGLSGHPVWRSVGSWVSMALIAAMLLAMGSMVWSLRPGADGDHSLLASATSLAMGTALASPSPVATDGEAWMRWPEQADCNAAPMPHEEYARIMSTQPDISGRSYEVAGTPTRADAVAAADAARRHFACEAFSRSAEERTLSSPAYTFSASYSSARTASDAELAATDLTHGMELSATIDPGVPQDYVGNLEGMPKDADAVDPSIVFGSGAYSDLVQLPSGPQIFASLTFNPEQATALADGRVAIPATMLGFDRFARTSEEIAALEVVAPPLYVMANEGGRWVVDEVLVYCPFAGCGPIWQALADKAGVPVPTVDVPVPWTIPNRSGTATPDATPRTDRTATPKA